MTNIGKPEKIIEVPIPQQVPDFPPDEPVVEIGRAHV